jgi:hypothetical protein
MIGPNMLRIPNVQHVPGLAESIYSLFLHIKQKDHGLQSSFDTGLLLNFPTFQTPAIVGSNNIYIDALPHVDNKIEENILPEPELSLQIQSVVMSHSLMVHPNCNQNQILIFLSAFESITPMLQQNAS